MSKIYTGAFAYHLGEESFNIEESLELCNDYELLTQFKESGLAKFWVCNSSPLTLAEKAIKESLSQLEIPPSKIDAVFYATNSFWNEEFHSQESICSLLVNNGLVEAYPVVFTFSFCAGVITALNAAYKSLLQGQYKNVLVVTADQLPGDMSRIVAPKISIASDAASCCFLSTKECFPWELKSPFLKFNAYLGMMDANVQFVDYMQGVGKGVTETIQGALTQAEIQVNDITKVMSNNYNKWISPSMLRLSDISSHQIYMDNISRFGHAGSSDIVLNLTEFMSTADSELANNLLLLATGPMMWGASVLKRCG